MHAAAVDVIRSGGTIKVYHDGRVEQQMPAMIKLERCGFDCALNKENAIGGKNVLPEDGVDTGVKSVFTCSISCVGSVRE